MRLNTIILFIYLICSINFVFAESPLTPREKLSFDFGWGFHLGYIGDYSTDVE